MKYFKFRPLVFSLALIPLVSQEAFGAADLFMRDTPADTGVEPNPDTGPMYVTQDIWVRNSFDPNFNPAPFPTAAPPWVPAGHQNPEYRDPKYSQPSYVYVRIHNRGDAPSSGTERLRLYFAKASTGLSWPTQWVDYIATDCGPSRLFGMEITKPRKNAAFATPQERADYVAAIQGIDAIDWADLVSYWDKQDEVHQRAPEHGNPAFLPWHREYINRYEVLLREVKPTLTLLYWDWTTDPSNSSGFNFYSSTFMGASGFGGSCGVRVGAPFGSLDANEICVNGRAEINPVFSNELFSCPSIDCVSNPNDWTFPPPVIKRRLNPGSPPAVSDSIITSVLLYPQMAVDLESGPHDNSHVYLGGSSLFGSALGNISRVRSAAEDPFFFLLHANCDRIWASWQRDPAQVGRLNRNQVYGTDDTHSKIVNAMSPWNGGSAIFPWTGAGGYTVLKSAKDPSVVFPPIYDNVALTIPVLQPNESVIIEIPWHPPNPADFACFGADQSHFCLLARIETATSAPFGMTSPETSYVHNNVRQNNNIVWKNIQVVDAFPGAAVTAGFMVRNVTQEIMATRLLFAIPEGEQTVPFFEFGQIELQLDPVLMERWQKGGGKAEGIRRNNDGGLEVFTPVATLDGIELNAEETLGGVLRFRLRKDYPHPTGRVFNFDVQQFDARGDFVGAQRFSVDFNEIRFVKQGEEWRYLDTGVFPGADWMKPGFDDKGWRSGEAELGFGDEPETEVDGGPADNSHPTIYFRREFNVDDPSIIRSLHLRLQRDDGAAVYLNGERVHLVHLPEQYAHDTLANTDVQGLAEEVFHPILLDERANGLVVTGRNVIAVEIHQSSKTSEDLSFDLQLSANAPAGNHPPVVKITSPFEGMQFQAGEPIQVTAEALDFDGRVLGAQFLVDGKVIGEDAEAPFSVIWQDTTVGPHRLTVVVGDDKLDTAEHSVQITVVENLAPLVEVTSPHHGANLRCASMITLTANAIDPAGSVASVEFVLKEAELFTGKETVLGEDTTAPFELTVQNLPEWEFRIFARAKDDKGLVGRSSSVHIMISESPRLEIVRENGQTFLRWSAEGVVLESASEVTGEWVQVAGQSPFPVVTTGERQFFRLLCIDAMPEEEPVPRIDPPIPETFLTLNLKPEALPEGGVAVLPGHDGDSFKLTLPSKPVEQVSLREITEQIVAPILNAIGFERGLESLRAPEEAGVKMPTANFAGIIPLLLHEYENNPQAMGRRTQDMLDVFQGLRPPDQAIDAALQTGEGMTFSQFVANVERQEILYPFQQVHDGVPIEHTMLLAARWDGFGITSVRGTLFNRYNVANQVTIDGQAEAFRRAVLALEKVPGIMGVTSKEPIGPVELVLLPYGADAAGLTQMRYAYRTHIMGIFENQNGPFLLWLDANTGEILKLDPGFDRVTARGEVYNRDPEVGTTLQFFSVDAAAGGNYVLRLAGAINRVDFMGDGFNAQDVSISDSLNGSSATLANFDQSPINNELQALCSSGSNKAYQQVNFFAVLYRYYVNGLSLGIFTPFPTSPWNPKVESASAGCNAWSTMDYGACGGYFGAGCPDVANEWINFAQDNTVIGHELGHNLTERFCEGRPSDWCGPMVCAIPLGWSRFHDLADFWADHFESCDCVAGYVAKNTGGVDNALNCATHNEGGGLPRLHRVAVPFNPASPGDHFPEHRTLATGAYAEQQMGTVALWNVRLGMRSKCRPSGIPQYAVRFARALRETGFMGADPGSSDRGLFRYLYDLEWEMADQWATAGTPGGPPAFAHNGAHTFNKVTAGFAKAGIFLIPHTQLDGDPMIPDNGGDAVIDIDDNDSGDDYSINGVNHPEVDFLELGGGAPTFHVWTGPRYRLDGAGGAATFNNPAPCNAKFQVEVSTDAGFAPAATITSAWINVDTDPTTPASPEGYGTWTPTPAEWTTLQAGGPGTRIYYRARTRDAADANERISTSPGNGMWTVPPPYAVITMDGQSDY